MDPDDDGGGLDTTTPKPAVKEKNNSRRTSLETSMTQQCKKTSCVMNESAVNKFQCNACKRSVHYRCSGLPVFQIQHFVYTKNYRNFVCETCTKIADHLKKVILTGPPSNPGKEIADLETTIKQLKVDSLAETNRILQARYKEMT